MLVQCNQLIIFICRLPYLLLSEMERMSLQTTDCSKDAESFPSRPTRESPINVTLAMTRCIRTSGHLDS